jgi:predicted ATP-grasp superfamily ATP-dependent carboligase
MAIKPVFSHKAKFENYLGSGAYAKIIVARNVAELDRYYDEFARHGSSLVIQEYIEGPDSGHYSYVSYRNSESVEIAGVGIRKIRLLPIHAGVGTFAEVTEDAELATLANKVLDKLNYKGISSVCFKRDANSGGLMVHELNGRFPQPHSGSRLCNIDFARIAYQDALGQEPELHRIPSGNRKWIALGLDIDAFREYRREGGLSTLEWLKSLWQVRLCVEFAPHDLRPFFFLLRRLLRRLAVRGSNKQTPVTPVAQSVRADLE